LPALIIAVATGIIVTRSSADRQLSSEMFRQLASDPRIPLIVMAVMAALMLMAGMPNWPIAILLAIAFLAWWRIRRAAQDDASSAPEGDDEALEASSGQVPSPLEIAFGSDLSRAWNGRPALLLDRIAGSRESHERNF